MNWEPVFSKRCQRLSDRIKTQTHHYHWYLDNGSFRALHLSDSEYRPRRKMLLFIGKPFIRQVTLHLNNRNVCSPLSFRPNILPPKGGKPAHGADIQLCPSTHIFHFKGQGWWQSWRFGSGFEPSGKSDQRKHYLPITKQFTATDLAQVF